MKNTLHGNTIVFLDRVALNLLPLQKNLKDSRRKLAGKILERTVKREIQENTPCMDVPVRFSQLKVLFPDYLAKPSIWHT